MTNHPNRSRGPYTAEIGGHSWTQGPTAEWATIRECRKWAAEFGSTADWCTVRDRAGRKVAEHRRDTSGDGLTWFRAAV